MTRKGLIAIFNNGLEFLIGTLMLITVTKSYSTEEAGVWIVFMTLLFVGSKFREGITQNSLIKFASGSSDVDRYSVYTVSIAITLGIEIIVSAIAAIAGLWMDGALSYLLIGYGFISVPQSIFRIFQFISQSRLEVKNMLYSNILLLNMIVMVLMYVLLSEIEFMYLPQILGFAYMTGVLWQILMHNVFGWNISLKSLKLPEGYLSFAFNGALRELFGTLSSRAYILLTAGMVGYTESALVGIASRYANLIYLPNSAYQGLLFPKACELFNNGYKTGMLGFYRRSVSWMQAAFIPYVTILLVLGSFGIVLLHGSEYLSSIPFFVILILSGAFIAPFGHAYGSICHAAGRPELVTKVVLFNSVLNLVLSYILIGTMGVWGAITASLVTDLFGLIMISVVLQKVFNTGIIEPVTRLFGRFLSLIKIVFRIVIKSRVLR